MDDFTQIEFYWHKLKEISSSPLHWQENDVAFPLRETHKQSGLYAK